MRNIIGLAGLLLLVSATSQALLAATPPPSLPITHVDAQYDVFKDDIKIGVVTETFTHTQDGYHIESVSKAVGLLALFKAEVIRVISEGTVTKTGLRPITFVQERKLDTDRNTRADFNWQTNLVTLTDHTGKRTLPLLNGTQDRVSALYQFMFMPLQNTTELNFNMTDGRKVKEYNYRITPDQNVTTPLGSFKSLYIASLVRANENRHEIWLATEHFNFPYKITITEPDGSKLIQALTHVNFEQQPFSVMHKPPATHSLGPDLIYSGI